MAAGDYRIGLDGVFFHGAAGTTAATESDNVRNVNLNLSKRLKDTKKGKCRPLVCCLTPPSSTAFGRLMRLDTTSATCSMCPPMQRSPWPAGRTWSSSS